MYRRNRMGIMGRLIITALVAICAFLCFDAQLIGAEPPEAKLDLRVGFMGKFLNDVSYADAQAALELWIREFTQSRSLDVHSKPYIFDDIDAMFNALKNKQIDVVGITPMDFIALRDRFPLEPALVALRRGALYGEQLVIVVRRDQNMTAISQLKGKRLMIHAGYMYDAEVLWLSEQLYRKHLPDKERFFSSIRDTKKVSQTVLPVFFKQADAALVSKGAFETMVDLNPQIGKELVTIDVSDKLLYGLFCFNKYLNADVKYMVIHNALNMHSTPAGKQILSLFQIDKVIEYNPRMLDTTLALVASANSHSRKETAQRKAPR